MITETWRKKSSPAVKVEVARLNEENAEEGAAWCGGQIVEEINPEYPDEKVPGINVQTPSGNQRASMGFYIPYLNGHFYVQKARIFEAFYEPDGETPGEDPNSSEAGKTRTRLGFSDPFEGITRV